MKYLKGFNESRIDWSSWDDYEYNEGDGLYLDENELRNGKIVTTDKKSPFINTKHPQGEHTLNQGMRDEVLKGKYKYRCSGCGEYKYSVSRNHYGLETIPLCKDCYEDN